MQPNGCMSSNAFSRCHAQRRPRISTGPSGARLWRSPDAARRKLPRARQFRDASPYEPAATGPGRTVALRFRFTLTNRFRYGILSLNATIPFRRLHSSGVLHQRLAINERARSSQLAPARHGARCGFCCNIYPVATWGGSQCFAESNRPAGTGNIARSTGHAGWPEGHHS